MQVNKKEPFYLIKIVVIIFGLCFSVSSYSQQNCSRCHGKGEITENCARCKGKKTTPCSTCLGTGKRNCGFCSGSGTMRCNYCQGRGYSESKMKECTVCKGKMEVPCQNCSGNKKIDCPNKKCENGKEVCRTCNGSGIHTWRCPDCRGTGKARY